MKSNSELLDDLLVDSIREIRNDYKEKGTSCGWHQFLGSEKVGNVATAQGIILLKNAHVDFYGLKEAQRFLLSNQLQSESKYNDGGWDYISNVQGTANTESTCWALRAISTFSEVNAEVVKMGVNWLEANFIQDQQYHGWGPTKQTGFRTFTTCFALCTLLQLGNFDDYKVKSARDTLKRTQNSDGGWGAIPNSHSTLTHTSHTIITLLESGMEPESSQIQRGISWLVRELERKNYDNSRYLGHSEMFDIIFESGGKKSVQRFTFYHMPMPYSVLALIKGKYKDEKLIFEIISSIIRSAEFGIWSHPFMVEKPIWAIYDAVSMLNQFIQSPYYEIFNEFAISSTTPRKYDVIIFTVVPIEFETLNRILNFAPEGKTEDFYKRGYWYYECTVNRNKRSSLSCLVTMIGSAGDINCYSACSTAFQEFDCDFAILCGIAAGNKKDIGKYSAIFAETIVGYEFQRIEDGKTTYRPNAFSVDSETKRLVEKRKVHILEWKKLTQDYLKKCDLDLANLKDFDENSLRLEAGAVASGAKLIADGKMLEILKREIPIEKGIVAAEMEGSGFAPCCNEFNKEWLVIRGISDYGEDDKNNPLNKKYQPLAVATAAASMIYYLKYYYRKFEER